MKRTGELAAELGLPLRGEPEKSIAGAAMLDDAGPDQLAFVGAPKYFEAALRSSAGCLIALPDYPARPDQTILTSPQPRAHFGQALAILYPAPPLLPGIHPSAQIDPTALIDPTAEIGPSVTIAAEVRIGARTRIGAGTFIGAHSSIGDDCTLHPRVAVYHRTMIGARCILHSGAVIGADGFGFEMAGGAYQKVPQVGTVSIGDNVEIGANTCIDRATLGVTVIGDGTKLDNMVHIAHNCVIGKHVVIAAQTGLAGGVSVGDYAVIGGQVGIGDKARIESKAVVGSGAGILTAKIVRAGEPVWGTPARPLRRYLAQLATLAQLARQRGAK
ncbi:MAG: UDP-3-O-(3-hydroxymyristoyl)glucosamine N-acyltransferase [Acidobacteriota bacterium]|nr:UDP-3-O-(3-hydroxymyristoyl)glucosamine N-acyltransferase [Acidobacteriota bacterium]